MLSRDLVVMAKRSPGHAGRASRYRLRSKTRRAQQACRAKGATNNTDVSRTAGASRRSNGAARCSAAGQRSRQRQQRDRDDDRRDEDQRLIARHAPHRAPPNVTAPPRLIAAAACAPSRSSARTRRGTPPRRQSPASGHHRRDQPHLDQVEQPAAQRRVEVRQIAHRHVRHRVQRVSDPAEAHDADSRHMRWQDQRPSPRSSRGSRQ